MTSYQKCIKYIAIALAILLIVCIVGGLFGLLSGVSGWLFGEDAVKETVEPVSLGKTAYASLEIDVSAAKLTLTEGDAWYVESNLKNLRIKENGDGLTLIDETRGSKRYSDPVLNITVPKGVTLERFVLTTGAGSVRVDALQTDRMELELGAGEVIFETLTVTSSADVETGAGAFSILQGSVQNLTLRTGVGEIRMDLLLHGRNRLEFGVGKATLNLVGSPSDYRLDIQKGLGSCTVDGRRLEENATVGTGDVEVSVTGGVGSVTVNFE